MQLLTNNILLNVLLVFALLIGNSINVKIRFEICVWNILYTRCEVI